jgi:hypothetical protein
VVFNLKHGGIKQAPDRFGNPRTGIAESPIQNPDKLGNDDDADPGRVPGREVFPHQSFGFANLDFVITSGETDEDVCIKR